MPARTTSTPVPVITRPRHRRRCGAPVASADVGLVRATVTASSVSGGAARRLRAHAPSPGSTSTSSGLMDVLSRDTVKRSLGREIRSRSRLFYPKTSRTSDSKILYGSRAPSPLRGGSWDVGVAAASGRRLAGTLPMPPPRERRPSSRGGGEIALSLEKPQAAEGQPLSGPSGE